MFIYTRAYFQKLIDDLKTVSYAINVFSPLVYIVYLIYAIFLPFGYLWANIILLVITVAYLVFYLTTYDFKEKSFKKTKSTVRHVCRGIKLGVGGLTLGITIYGIYVAATHTTVLSIVLSCFMVAFWFIQVAIELFTYIFEYQSELFIAAIEADKDTILKPINAVGNFVKKVVGKEPEQPKEPKKILKVLDKTIEKIKSKKNKKTEDDQKTDQEEFATK